MSTTEAATAIGEDRGYRYRWMVMTVVILADVMDLLDSTVANLAGPSIRHDLGGSTTTLQWILAAYTLTFAVALITSSRLGDLVGRRRMFVIGMVGFTIASLCCGLAPSVGFLIAARVAQGLFGATMIPQGLAMVKASFHPDDLQKAFIPFGPAMGLSAVLGPIIAGVLINADIAGSGWRAIFWINVPVGTVASYLAWRYLPRNLDNDGARGLDPIGAVLLTVSSAALIYPLVQGQSLGWPAWIYGLFVAAIIVFAGFVWRERTSSNPIIEPSLFGHRGFVGGLAFLGTFFTGMSGFMLAINIYLQYGLHRSPLHTGIAMTPWALGMAIGAAVSGAALGPKFGRRVVHGGLIITVIGLAILWFALHNSGPNLSGWALTPGFLVMGMGSGAVFAPLFDIILAALGDHEVGTGSGLLNAVQQFCGALGVAALGTAFFHWVPRHGYAVATEWLIIAAGALYVLSFGVAFLMPKQARADAVH